MNLLKFSNNFPNGASSKAKWNEIRDKEGLLCFVAFHLLITTKNIFYAKELQWRVLSWLNIAVSNTENVLLNIFHSISLEYLQNYLNEFCYKFNRRYFDQWKFDRLRALIKMSLGIIYNNHFL